MGIDVNRSPPTNRREAEAVLPARELQNVLTVLLSVRRRKLIVGETNDVNTPGLYTYRYL